MNKYLIIVIAAGVLIVLGGFLVKQYGNAQYNAGFQTAHAEALLAAKRRASEANKEMERIENETARLSDSDVDDSLRDLGIMRDVPDR